MFNAPFSVHSCAGIFVLIDDSKRKMSTLVKRDVTILKCSW